MNGWGNHESDPSQGSTGAPFARRGGLAFYADRTAGIDGSLPNARLVSSTVFAQRPFRYNEHAVSYMAAVWGQFVAHDMIMTTPHNATAGSPEVVTVAVPSCDTAMDRACTGTQTLSFKRNLWDTSTGTSMANPRVLLNSQTSFLDASVVYGPTADRAALLRTFRGGLLREDSTNGAPVNMDNVFQAGPFPASNQRVTGDPRGNVNPGLLSLHGLFMLEHNRWARLLGKAHPRWSDELLFQAARKRVAAIIQAITFFEYAPILLGEGLPAYDGYDASVDPSVTGDFGFAAYRYGHSGINNMYQCIQADGSSCPAGHLLLRDSYFQPQYLDHMTISDILRGLVLQPENAIDTSMVDDVRNFVEGVRADLAVYDIMRGRDAGLPSYSTTRNLYGLPRPRTYADITDSIPVQNALEAVYGKDGVDRVELWVGGLAESARTGAAFVSDTFRAIIKDQLTRTRDGDRFYFENAALGHLEAGSFVPYFTAEERAALRATRLADVIKRNTDFANAPASVFRVPSGVTIFGGGMGSTAAVHDDGTTDVVTGDDDAATSDGGGGSGNSTGGTTTQVAAKRTFNVNSHVQLEWMPPTESDTELELTVRLGGTGWVAVGFGTGMSDADVVLCRFQNGEAEVIDAASTMYSLPLPDASQDVTVVDASTDGASMEFTFSRPVDSGDGEDKAIAYQSDGTATPMIFAWSLSSNQYASHGPNRIAGSVDLHTQRFVTVDADGNVVDDGGSSGGGSGGFSAAELAAEAFKQRLQTYGFHGMSMFSTWAVMAPAAVMCVRFFKHAKQWLSFHKWAMMMAGTLTIPAIGAAMSSGGGKAFFHALLGLFIGVGMLGQMILGAMLRNWLRASKRPPLVNFRLTKITHRIGGWILIAIGLLNSYLGVSLLLPHIKFWIAGYIGLVIVAYIVAAIWDEFQRDAGANANGKLVASIGTSDTRLTAESLASSSQCLTMADVRKNVRAGCKWVIINNMIFDAGPFAKHHPGGSYLIDKNCGQDVTQYFFGRADFDALNSRHVHSVKAHRLLSSYVVGVLAKSHDVLATVSGAEVETATWSNMPHRETDRGERWKLVRRRLITGGRKPVIRLEFEHTMAPGARAIHWRLSTLGRYVTVRLATDMRQQRVLGREAAKAVARTRRLSLVAAAADEGGQMVRYTPGALHSEKLKRAASTDGLDDLARTARARLVRADDENPHAMLIERPYTVVRRDGRGGFDMYVRRYMDGCMSPLLHALSEGDFVEMIGPKGLGVQLPDDASGVVVCIAQGTGICTYFELLQYITAQDRAEAGAMLQASAPNTGRKLPPGHAVSGVQVDSLRGARAGRPPHLAASMADSLSATGPPISAVGAPSATTGGPAHRSGGAGSASSAAAGISKPRHAVASGDDDDDGSDDLDAEHPGTVKVEPWSRKQWQSRMRQRAELQQKALVPPMDLQPATDLVSGAPFGSKRHADVTQQVEAALAGHAAHGDDDGEDAGSGGDGEAKAPGGAGATPAELESRYRRHADGSGSEASSFVAPLRRGGLFTGGAGSTLDLVPGLPGRRPPGAGSTGQSTAAGTEHMLPRLISVGSVTLTTARDEARYRRAKMRARANRDTHKLALRNAAFAGSESAAGGMSTVWSPTEGEGRQPLRCVLLACFATEADVVERDWLLQVSRSSPNIELHVNVTHTDGTGYTLFDNFSTGRLAPEKLLEVLPPRSLHSVSICGSPDFNRTISDQYSEMGLPKGLVVIT